MKLKKIRLKNFRGYKDSDWILIGDFTAFVGKNDVGKSTILEALDVFFNGGLANSKISEADICVSSKDECVEIRCVFECKGEQFVIDESEKTDLSEEYWVNEDGFLEVVKRYTRTSLRERVLIAANYPISPGYSKVFAMSQEKLQKKVDELGIKCKKNSNVLMRKSIRRKLREELSEKKMTELDLSAGEVTKKRWLHLSQQLPTYELFRADRENGVGDDDVQNPFRIAVRRVLEEDREVVDRLKFVANRVKNVLDDVMGRTLKKISEMCQDNDYKLLPEIPLENLKWQDVFKGITLKDDAGVAVDKHGSGLRRLVLLNFFRAEAERKQDRENRRAVIYAVEEPETGQHYDNQSVIVDALKTVSEKPFNQMIITTHSGNLLSKLELSQVRIVERNGGSVSVRKAEDDRGFIVKPRSKAEVAYVLFKDCLVEYHSELFGYLEACKLDKSLDDFAQKFAPSLTKEYCRDTAKPRKHGWCQYVRDRIHHPENPEYDQVSADEVRQSVELMRKFWRDKGKFQLESKLKKSKEKRRTNK